MELTLNGHPTWHVGGKLTVELPDYIKRLPEEELVEVRGAVNRDGLIVAAGRHITGDIVFLTGAGELMELTNHDWKLPSGAVMPVDFGQAIRITIGPDEAYEIANTWAIKNAQMIIFLGAMVSDEGSRVSYIDR